MNAFDGTLDKTPLSEVLVRLRGQSATGVLTLQSAEDIVAISLENGSIVGADALNETLEEGLGRVMIDEGLVTDEQFQAAAGRVGTQGGRIGDILVGDGLVSRDDFLAILRRYTRNLVRDAQGWTTGDFRFYLGEEISYEEGFEPIRIKEVLLTGVPTARPPEEPPETAEASAPGEAVEVEDRAELEATVEESALFEEAEPDALGTETEDEAGLEEEIDLPPLRLALRRADVWLAGAPDWIASVAPLLVVLVLAVMVLWRPNSLVYPFFWLETERLELEKQRRNSVYLKIDRGAKTFFLLEGRFPDDLHVLVNRGLLASEDIVGEGGRILSYVPGDRGYVIRPAATDGTDPGVSKTEAIAGDFFLDPEFVIQSPDRGPAPLVLLD